MEKLYISKVNSHLEDYLNYYLSENTGKLQYSVLINAAWGAGKTWFVKKYIEKYQESERHIIYVSLNGIESIEQLDGVIYSELYPVINGKAGEFLISGFGTLLKGIKIDLTGFDYKKFMRVKNTVVLFFDDLERCKISIETVMGHINYFVEQLGIKTILIADEKQISDATYPIIKEKVIDATLGYTEDVNSTVESILNSVEDDELRGKLKQYQEDIVSIFFQVGYKNLRSLKQTIYSFEDFYEKEYFFREDSYHENVFFVIFRFFLIFSLEYKKGTFDKEILKFKNDEKNNIELVDRIKGIGSIGEKDFCAKYNISILRICFSKNDWTEILINKKYCKKTINECLDLKFYNFSEKPTWYRLMNYTDLSETEFDNLIEECKGKFAKNEFDNIADVLHTFSNFVYLRQCKLITYSTNQIRQDAIDSFFSIYEMKEGHQNIKEEINRGHYSGYAYYAKGIEEFNLFIDEIYKNYEEKYKGQLGGKASELLTLMLEDPNLFYHRIGLTNSRENYYYDVPILLEIQPDKFANELCILNREDSSIILSGLKNRYQVIMNNSPYNEERGWLESVISYLETMINGTHVCARLTKAKIELNLLPALQEIKYIGDELYKN